MDGVLPPGFFYVIPTSSHTWCFDLLISLALLHLTQMTACLWEVSRLLFDPFSVSVPQAFRTGNCNIYGRENVTVRKAD